MNYKSNADGANIAPSSDYVNAARDIATSDAYGPGGISEVALMDLSARVPLILGDTFDLYPDEYHPNDAGYLMTTPPVMKAVCPR
ncbi:hypothetical protein [Arthrobacter sp. NA-172]|uniref:hypothetical protein n=1 Tax=Arthrobacter sp. NA-172 TaxID=3367524 RepID=UPI003754ADDD